MTGLRIGSAPGARCWVLILVLGALSGVPAYAQAQMPDPSQMSGVPLPSPELPAGTITVRVVRGSIGNNLPGQRVALTVGGAAREATTDEMGRATFPGLNAGDQVQASVSVDGKRIESQVITLPAQGGVRVMLFAADGATAAREAEDARLRDAPAERGLVVLGGESRFIVERGDESLNVFYVLEVVNTARTPIDAGGPLLFDLPSGATGITLLEGSTPQATIGGSRVTVTGPFAPGKTSLQVAYELPYRGSRAVIEQRMPAALPQLAVAGETSGQVTMSSSQFTTSREMNADGRTFLVGNGPGIPAGSSLVVQFDNLPHHVRWPRFAALGLAVAIMIFGLAAGWRGGSKATSRAHLMQARDARLAELESLEQSRQEGRIGPDHYGQERERVISALEDIYGALDEQPA
ncbi:MAG: hypothetical protein M3R55_00015 [Acidobacteriota bacterium]|nr:hypothetical protein [Acidobacteriota bacterium]